MNVGTQNKKMNEIDITFTDDLKALAIDEYLRLLRGSYWASKRTDDEDTVLLVRRFAV